MTTETTRPKSVHLRREALYEQIWTTPIVQLAKTYGISDVGLAKICKRLNIPRPGLGYWAKLQHGKPVHKTPLPRATPNTPPMVVIHRQPDPIPPEDPKPLDPLMEAERLPENRVTVASTLHGPHPLLKATAAALRGDKYSDQYGRVYAGRTQFNIRVGKESIERVLRILNALLKACDRRGYTYREPNANAWEDTTHIRIVVLGHPITFRIAERATQIKQTVAKDDWRTRRVRYTPNGRLQLQLDGYYGNTNRFPQIWEDREGHPIEESLNSFLASLIAAARAEERKKQEAIEVERRRQEAHRQWLIQEEHRKAEEAKISDLLAQTTAWTQSLQIRAYLAAVKAARVTEITPDSELSRWLGWAERYAAKIDPLSNRD